MKQLDPQPNKKIAHHYVVALTLSFSAILMSVLAINLAIDPLWYWKGNQITAVNFAFNERLAKVNLFHSRQKEVDCVIFGSSRTTLLNEKKIEGYNCFNLAFSSGRIEEFIAYAHYIKHSGFKPKLVIVGIDYFNFTTSKPLNIPDFVRNMTSPPNVLESYLSSSALEWSIQTLNGKSKLPRFYGSDFTTRILPSAPQYKPTIKKTSQLKKLEPNNKVFQYYKDFKEIFPESTLIAYVPPVSAWEVTKIYQAGNLGFYITMLTKLSKTYTTLFDFSIPSDITANTTLTYDGSHYNKTVNLEIAKTLSGTPSNFGGRTNNYSYDTLHKSYTEALTQFHNGLHIELTTLELN